MKRIFIIIGLILLLAACGDNEPYEEASKLDEIINEFSEIADEHDEKELDVYEQADAIQEEIDVEVKNSQEIEKELYIKMLNMLLNEYDDNYDIFDTEIAINVYDLITTHPSGIEGAINFKEAIIGVMSEEEQEVYGEYFDDVIGLEETFPNIDWSD